jgi:hypothetical protein
MPVAQRIDGRIAIVLGERKLIGVVVVVIVLLIPVAAGVLPPADIVADVRRRIHHGSVARVLKIFVSERILFRPLFEGSFRKSRLVNYRTFPSDVMPFWVAPEPWSKIRNRRWADELKYG